MPLHDHLPGLPALIAFEAAAKHKNFTAAAREIGSSQSAVSQQVRALELSLQTELFRRIYRGVTLTEAGNELYKVVSESLHDIADCVEKLRAGSAKKYLNVATDFAFAAFWLMPRLPEFRKLHPDIEVRIVTTQERRHLQSTDSDVAIMFDTPEQQHNNLRLFGESVFPICSPGFLAQHNPIKSHKRLASLPLLKLRTDSDQPWMSWSSYLNARHSQVEASEPVMVLDTYTLVTQAAAAGQGMALGWKYLVDDMIGNGSLIALEEFSVTTDRGYYAIEAEPTPGSQALMDWLKQQAAAE